MAILLWAERGEAIHVWMALVSHSYLLCFCGGTLGLLGYMFALNAYMCVRTLTCPSMHVQVRDNFLESVLSFHLCPGD